MANHDKECCPHCDARLERGDDGLCNRCGKKWAKETRMTPQLLKQAVEVMRKAVIARWRQPSNLLQALKRYGMSETAAVDRPTGVAKAEIKQLFDRGIGPAQLGFV